MKMHLKTLSVKRQPFRPVNSSPLGQNGSLFADGIFSCFVIDIKSSILTKMSLRFVPKGPIDNEPALV